MRPSKRKFMLKDDPGNLLAPVFGAYRQRLSDGKYAPKVQALYFATVFHFGDWLKTEGVALGQVRDRHIRQFLADHLPSCVCDRHTRGDTHANRAALHLLGRVSEVAVLRLDDLVLGPSSVVHLKGKGRKQRSVPLWRQTAATLRNWLDQDDRRDGSRPLFPSAKGNPLTRSSIARRLELAVGKAAVTLPERSKRTVSPHIIRHSTAMHLLQSGVDISVIALWLGHESPTTTHVYLSADMVMKEEALLRLQPADVGRARYEAPDNLLAFLKSL